MLIAKTSKSNFQRFLQFPSLEKGSWKSVSQNHLLNKKKRNSPKQIEFPFLRFSLYLMNPNQYVCRKLSKRIENVACPANHYPTIVYMTLCFVVIASNLLFVWPKHQPSNINMRRFLFVVFDQEKLWARNKAATNLSQWKMNYESTRRGCSFAEVYRLAWILVLAFFAFFFPIIAKQFETFFVDRDSLERFC